MHWRNISLQSNGHKMKEKKEKKLTENSVDFTEFLRKDFLCWNRWKFREINNIPIYEIATKEYHFTYLMHLMMLYLRLHFFLSERGKRVHGIELWKPTLTRRSNILMALIPTLFTCSVSQPKMLWATPNPAKSRTQLWHFANVSLLLPVLPTNSILPRSYESWQPFKSKLLIK